MDTDELRRGNLIIGTNELIGTVTNINQSTIRYDVDNELENVLDSPEVLNPIPLTVEWLDKLGFETVDAMDADGIEDHYYVIRVDKFRLVSLRPFEEVEIDMTSISVKYVHKLQNLYFELKGSELINS